MIRYIKYITAALACMFVLYVTMILFCLSVFISAANAKEITYTKDGVMTLNGQFMGDEHFQFQRVLETMRINGVKPRLLKLHSPGGASRPGFIIGTIVHQMKIDTVVENDKFCFSACAFVWLAGQRKIRDMESAILFHPEYYSRNKCKRIPKKPKVCKSITRGRSPNNFLAVGYYLGSINIPFQVGMWILEAHYVDKALEKAYGKGKVAGAGWRHISYSQFRQVGINIMYVDTSKVGWYNKYSDYKPPKKIDNPVEKTKIDSWT